MLRLLAPFLLFAVGLLSTPTYAQPTVRVDHLIIRVHDMDAALAFYHTALGFPIQSRDEYPRTVTLSDPSFPLVLEQVPHPALGGYPAHTQTSLSLQAADLTATMQRLRDEGITFSHDPPIPYGQNTQGEPLGVTTWIEDPSGNVVSLLEQHRSPDSSFTGVRIYNLGFYIPGSQIDAGLRFCSVLGFTPLTSIYAHNYPMQDAAGTFAFMLHGREEPTPLSRAAYPDHAQFLLVFSTNDLDATQTSLQHHPGVQVHLPDSHDTNGNVVAFQNPFGITSLLMEVPAVPSP